jgi:hypothetical protein
VRNGQQPDAAAYDTATASLTTRTFTAGSDQGRNLCSSPAVWLAMDYRASWQEWAKKNYGDGADASTAAEAAIGASARGAAQREATIAAHRAVVAAGGEYVCRPDRAGMAIAICVVVSTMLVLATLFGLAANPVLAGYLFLAGSIALPVLGVAGLVQVRKNSCFFVTRYFVGRRNWRGKVVASVAREGVSSVAVRAPARDSVVLWDQHEEPSVLVTGRGGEPLIPLTQTYWWSVARIREFAAVATPP